MLCRYTELAPGPRGAWTVARAAHDAGDFRKCYQVAIRAIHALGQESSSFYSYMLNRIATNSLECGALGPTWSWSQVAPFVANMRTAGKRLKRWMVPAFWEKIVKDPREGYALAERWFGDDTLG